LEPLAHLQLPLLWLLLQLEQLVGQQEQEAQWQLVELQELKAHLHWH